MFTRKAHRDLQNMDVLMKVENYGMATKFSIEKCNADFHVKYITILAIIFILFSYKYVQAHYSCLILMCLLIYLFYTINGVTKGMYL